MSDLSFPPAVSHRLFTSLPLHSSNHLQVRSSTQSRCMTLAWRRLIACPWRPWWTSSSSACMGGFHQRSTHWMTSRRYCKKHKLKKQSLNSYYITCQNKTMTKCLGWLPFDPDVCIIITQVVLYKICKIYNFREYITEQFNTWSAVNVHACTFSVLTWFQ